MDVLVYISAQAYPPEVMFYPFHSLNDTLLTFTTMELYNDK